MVTGMTSCKRVTIAVFDNGPLINTLAFAARLPTMHSYRRHVVSGGLMSYGANYIDLSRRAADYVDKILRGVKPADLAVQQPTKVRAGDQSQNC